MAIEKKKPFPTRKASTLSQQSASEELSDPYKLKLQAVEDLVTANSDNSPPVSREELKKYHAAPKPKVADWIKAVFLKFWMAGTVCYFFVWGLSTFTLNQWDLIMILGVVLGGLTYLITNNIFRFIARTRGAYDRWMMFPKDKIWFLPLNLVYGLVLVLCVVGTYGFLNSLFSTPDTVALGVEPLLFGLLTTLWDLLFLSFKSLFRRILKDAKKSASHA